MTTDTGNPQPFRPARPGPPSGSRLVQLPVGTVRFSQCTVSSPTRLHDVEVSLAELVAIFQNLGFVSEPIAVVRMPDGMVTSLDNRRLWAARQAGLEKIHAIIHRPHEPWGSPRQQQSLTRMSPLIDEQGDFGPAARILLPPSQLPGTHLLAVLRRCANQEEWKGDPNRKWGSLDMPRDILIRVPKRTLVNDQKVQRWASVDGPTSGSPRIGDGRPTGHGHEPRDGGGESVEK